MTLRRHSVVLAVFLYFVHQHLVVVSAITKSELLFSYGEAVSDQSLVNETDDYNSVEVPLTTPVIFYNETYNSIYVSLLPWSLHGSFLKKNYKSQKCDALCVVFRNLSFGCFITSLRVLNFITDLFIYYCLK